MIVACYGDMRVGGLGRAKQEALGEAHQEHV